MDRSQGYQGKIVLSENADACQIANRQLDPNNTFHIVPLCPFSQKNTVPL